MPATSIEPTPLANIEVINVPEVWALLWSRSQNALHIESLSDMQRANLDAFADNRRMDYVPLQIGSRDAVDMAAAAIRPICHARAEAAGPSMEAVQ